MKISAGVVVVSLACFARAVEAQLLDVSAEARLLRTRSCNPSCDNNCGHGNGKYELCHKGRTRCVGACVASRYEKNGGTCGPCEK